MCLKFLKKKITDPFSNLYMASMKSLKELENQTDKNG